MTSDWKSRIRRTIFRNLMFNRADAPGKVRGIVVYGEGLRGQYSYWLYNTISKRRPNVGITPLVLSYIIEEMLCNDKVLRLKMPDKEFYAQEAIGSLQLPKVGRFELYPKFDLFTMKVSILDSQMGTWASAGGMIASLEGIAVSQEAAMLLNGQ